MINSYENEGIKKIVPTIFVIFPSYLTALEVLLSVGFYQDICSLIFYFFIFLFFLFLFWATSKKRK